METAQKDKVVEIIDGMKDEIVQTVSELVQIRSVNPGYPVLPQQRIEPKLETCLIRNRTQFQIAY